MLISYTAPALFFRIHLRIITLTAREEPLLAYLLITPPSLPTSLLTAFLPVQHVFSTTFSFPFPPLRANMGYNLLRYGRVPRPRDLCTGQVGFPFLPLFL